MKRFWLTLVIMTVGISVLAGVAIPHHHHEESEIICLCAEVPVHNEGCGCDSRESNANDCCQFGKDLTSPFADSRRENHCDCGSHLHIHLYAIIIPSSNADSQDVPLIFSGTNEDRHINHYLSAVVRSNSGLRAPPSSYSYTL